MLITEDYADQNRQLHLMREDYGSYGGMRFAGEVFRLCAELETTDVLDYGCGKATLNQQLPFAVQCYDPCLPKYEEEPSPADIVVCTDVLEHVEPECIEDVLEHIHSLTKKVLLLNVAMYEAEKQLPDGRNAHVLVRPLEWWQDMLRPDWETLMMQSREDFTGIFRPREVQ